MSNSSTAQGGEPASPGQDLQRYAAVSSRSRPDHNAYGPVVAAYAERYFDELAYKPFDRMWLDRFADLTRALGQGVRCWLWTTSGGAVPPRPTSKRHLRYRHLAEMVQQAARLSPDIPFERQDMLAFDLPSDSLGGIVAFYAIVHFDLEQVGISGR